MKTNKFIYSKNLNFKACMKNPRRETAPVNISGETYEIVHYRGSNHFYLYGEGLFPLMTCESLNSLLRRINKLLRTSSFQILHLI